MSTLFSSISCRAMLQHILSRYLLGTCWNNERMAQTYSGRRWGLALTFRFMFAYIASTHCLSWLPGQWLVNLSSSKRTQLKRLRLYCVISEIFASCPVKIREGRVLDLFLTCNWFHDLVPNTCYVLFSICSQYILPVCLVVQFYMVSRFQAIITFVVL